MNIFPNGPWMNETDAFIIDLLDHEEYEGFANRAPEGYWCGYVCVPVTDSLIGIDTRKLHCHGGITYSSNVEPVVGKVSPNHWYFGFDCSHENDFIPGRLDIITQVSRIVHPDDLARYRDVKFVTEHIQFLAFQIKHYEEHSCYMTMSDLNSVAPNGWSPSEKKTEQNENELEEKEKPTKIESNDRDQANTNDVPNVTDE